MKTLFGLESDEKVEVTVEEYTVSDAIDAITLESEINESLNEIETLESVAEQAELLATELEVSSELDKVALESDDITPVVAKMSVASLNNISKLLGVNVNQYDISLESMENDPKAAVAISLEEKKNILKRIWDKIKEILTKILNSIKKIIFKLTKNYDKQLDLIAELIKIHKKNLRNPNWRLTEESVIRIKFASIHQVTGKPFNGKSIKKLSSVVSDKTKLPKKLTDIAKTYSIKERDKDLITKLSKMFKFDTFIDNWYKDYNILPTGLNNSKAFTVMMSGNRVGLIYINNDNKLKYISHKLNGKGTSDSFKIENISNKDIGLALSNIKCSTNPYEKVLTDIDDATKEMEALIKKNEKAETIDKIEYELYKNITLLLPSVGLEEAKTKYRIVNDIIWLANLNVKKIKDTRVDTDNHTGLVETKITWDIPYLDKVSNKTK